MAIPPGYAPNADVCMAPPRPAETLPTLAETNASHTDKLCEQNLAGAPMLLQGFGGYTRVCASAPHGTAQQREGKNIPSASISLCGFLTNTTVEARGLLLGTAIRVP
jgi:hypothetical protein